MYLKQIICSLTAVFCLLSVSSDALAYYKEGVKVCGSYYRRNGSLSHGYKLTMTEASGDEMNRILKSDSFNPEHNYFMVRWKKGGTSIFSQPQGYNLSSDLHTDYFDQRGKKWILKKGWKGCH